MRGQLNLTEHQVKVREALKIDFHGLQQQKSLHQRLETENLEGQGRLVTEIDDLNFDIKSWDEKARISLKKPRTRTIGVQPSVGPNRSIAVGQTILE